MRILKLNMRTNGLNELNRELDRIADKHDIEEPLRLIIEPENEDDEDEQL